MELSKMYNKIHSEIITIQEMHNCTQEEYVKIFGDLEDRDDYESMLYYLYDIDKNLPSMYESLYNKIVSFFEQGKQFTILKDFIDKFKNKMLDPQEIRKKYNL